MFKLARAAGVLVGALILLYAIDLALLNWWTSDPMFVQVDPAPAAESTLDPSSNDSSSLGDQTAAQEQLFQARAYEGLSTWAMATTGLAGMAILAWFAVAFTRERRTYGPASQTSAFPYWILVVVAYVAGAVAMFFWAIAPMDLVRFIADDLDLYLLTGIVGLLGGVAIWIASIIGIGPVLRPSVPLGARFS